MIHYNDEDKFWSQRVQKEVWNTSELKEFQRTQLNAEQLRQQYGIQKKANLGEVEVTLRGKLDRVRHQRRIMKVQQGMSDELSNHDNNSIWSKVPPSPRAANEDLIWKSRVSQKNQLVRGQNGAYGRLGQYIILDPENRKRLDDKLKTVIKNARVTPGPRNSGNYNTADNQIAPLDEMLKLPNTARKRPAKLDPLGAEYKNMDISENQNNGGSGPTASALARRGSHVMPDIYALDALVGSSRNSRHGASTNRSQASNNSTNRKRVLQIKGMLEGGSKASKARFNEDVEDETKSIRQEAALKGGLNSMLKRSSLPELPSQISGAMSGVNKSMRSRQSYGAFKTDVSALDKESARSIQRRQASQSRLSQDIPAGVYKDEGVTDTASCLIANKKLKEETTSVQAVVNKVRPDGVKFDENVVTSNLDTTAKASYDEPSAAITPVVKFDADSTSTITYITENSSLNYNPSSIATVKSSQLEMQLTFLARQLEVERLRREKLQNEVESMAGRLREIEEDGRKEAEKNETVRQEREKNIKPPNMDVSDLRVLKHGFVAIQ